MVYFFAGLIKHEIHMKCEKCIVSVSYFVVWFAKYEKCVAALPVKQKYDNGWLVQVWEDGENNSYYAQTTWNQWTTYFLHTEAL